LIGSKKLSDVNTRTDTMRVYAQRDDNGQCVLVALKCDRCGTEIEPHPKIGQSGWVKYISDNGLGTEKFELHYCSACQQE